MHNAMIDISGVVLETERLILREWRLSDLDDFNEYASVEGVGEMAGWTHHKDKEESMKILRLFIKGKKTFALELKKNHKVIGSLGLEEVTPALNNIPVDKVGREIGYVLSKDYWGNGLMVEAVKRVIQYCFEDLKLDFLSCEHFGFNIQSKRVIEKSGFQFVKNYKIKNPDNVLINFSLYVIERE